MRAVVGSAIVVGRPHAALRAIVFSNSLNFRLPKAFADVSPNRATIFPLNLQQAADPTRERRAGDSQRPHTLR
jgi:hypothetical protein